MNIKRYMFIALIFLVLTISAVSAADDATNDIVSADDNGEIILDEAIDDDVSNANDNYDELILEDSSEDGLVGSENDKPSLKDGETGSFTDLNKLINVDWSTNVTISLYSDYNFTSADSGFVHGIVLDRQLTIDGQYHTIDGNHGARIFNVSDEANVKFLNINFINGNASGDDFEKIGGAIYTLYGTCAAENCNFTNNNAQNNGGAIRGVDAYDCTFISNTADIGGAMSGGTAKNCNFSGNTAYHDGGAIYNGEANDCRFTGNTAKESDGGAMYYGTANNCNFTGNAAYDEGGAMYKGEANNCNFTGNTVSRNDGGAMFNGTANNCNFTGNTAHDEGGGLYRGEANNCTFTGNEGNCGGGMMYGTANNCTFFNNIVDDTGEAIMEGTANNCTFILILHTKGSTIDGSQCDDDCRFIPAKINAPDFLTYLHSNETLPFKLTATVDNEEIVINDIKTAIRLSKDGEDAGTYYANSGEGWKVDLEPGPYDALFIVEDSQVEPVTATIKVSDGTTFWDLNRDINGNDASEVTLNKSYKFNPDFDSNFKNGCYIGREVTIDGNNHTIDADGKARMFRIDSYDVKFKNINFINAYLPQNIHSDNSGGAIFTQRNCYVENCNFTNNVAGAGCAISSYRNCTAVNCIFSGNHKYDGSSGDGGAIKCINATIENCNFTGNIAYHGGAVYASLMCTVVNSNFNDNNNTSGYGGAIYTSNCTAKNCNFTGNKGEIGGALYATAYCNVSDCIFLNNNATRSVGGGAIWSFKMTHIENSIFMNNRASEGYGGAVIIRESIGNVFNCTFINNSAQKGDAIYLQGYEIIVSGCSFINNTGNITLYFDCPEDRDLKINNNTFLNNDNNYIFLLKNKGILDVDYNWFGNNATNYTDKPNDLCNNWLFLNATANPETASSSGKAYISFSLYLYDPISGIPSDYENAPFENVNLTVTGTNGDVQNTAKLGEEIEFTPADAGIGSVTATIENVAETIEFSIKSEPEFTIENKECDYGETSTISHSLSDGATGTIKYYLEDGTYLGESDASENFTLPLLDAGSYTLVANYSGDGRFFNASATATLTVNKAATEITPSSSSINLFVGDGSSVGYALNPSGAVGDITFACSNPKVVSVDSSGSIKALAEGTATITISFAENANYKASNATVNVAVNKKATKLTASAVTATYNANKNLVITLKDSQGKAISGATLSVDLNGAKKYTTDKNGQVKVAVGKLTPKAYTAKISFAGDDKYIGSDKTVKVTVKKAKPKITAKKKSFKQKAKVKKYTVTLKNNVGKVLKSKKLTLKVKGKTYKAKTNKKGKATFKIKNLKKKGKYTAVIKFAGDKYYKKASKKVKLTVKKSKSWKTIARGSKDKSTVKKIQRALKDNGYYLSYKGRYLKVDGKYGRHTERGVKQFQKPRNLKVTGKVDEKTAKKLKII